MVQSHGAVFVIHGHQRLIESTFGNRLLGFDLAVITQLVDHVARDAFACSNGVAAYALV